MRISIPRAQDYGISPTRGFLPIDDPLKHIPDPLYTPWETLANDLPSLMQMRRVRHAVDQLDVISTEHLYTPQEIRRAYSLLGFILNAYIWSDNQPATVVPPQISIPFKALCIELELPPVATYAGLVLWNYKLASPELGADVVDNLSSLTTFTGLEDESWFYMVSVAIEARGAPMIPMLLEALESAYDADIDRTVSALNASARCLGELSSLLSRMYERCNPNVFYHQLRHFFAGSADVQRGRGQSNGVLFEDKTPEAQIASYRGASNAQSSLFHFLDIVLGVDHQDHVSSTTTEKPRENFLRSMRTYMPGPHRRFLESIETFASLRDFAHGGAPDDKLVAAFNGCVDALLRLRRKHIQIVTRYIILTGSNERHATRMRDTKAHTGLSSALDEDSSRRGTGGTKLIPFLKQAAQETREAAVDVHSQVALVEIGRELRPLNGPGRSNDVVHILM